MSRKITDNHLGSAWHNEKDLSKISARYDERSLLFFVFSYVSLAVAGILLLMAWYLLEPGLARFHRIFPAVFSALCVGFWAVLFIDITLMLASVGTGKNFVPYYHAQGRVAYLMPLIMRLGVLLGIVPDRMVSSFLAVNNRLTHIIHRKKKKENILILLPRCLQHLSCRQPVVTDINACKSCGKCDIVRLVKLNREYRLVTAVATGGSFARRLIKEYRPHGVIAVACEREIMAGVRGIKKVPLIAIANTRPEGPCKNTKVDVAAIERAIRLFKDA